MSTMRIYEGDSSIHSLSSPQAKAQLAAELRAWEQWAETTVEAVHSIASWFHISWHDHGDHLHHPA